MKGTYDVRALEAIDVEVESHKKAIDRLLEQRKALLKIPKIGDAITIEDGFSHTGKRMVVTSVHNESGWRGEFRVRGTLIKQDGKVGKARADEPVK